MEEELYETIGRYVAGELSEDERKAFEKKMQADPVLHEKVQLFSAASHSLSVKLSGEQQETKLKETLSRLGTEYIIANENKPIKWYALSAAACIALVMAFYFYTSPKPRYEEYANFEPMAIAERGVSDSIVILAEKTFNAKKYEEAIQAIDRILQEEPGNTELKIYKGIALLQTDRFNEANVLFDSIRATPTVYQNQALWLRALSALKEKEYDVCRTLLQEIKPEEEKYKQAQEILDDL